MKIANLSAIMIVREGFIFRAQAISKRLQRPKAVLEMVMQGRKLPRALLDQAWADLEYLNLMAGAKRKQEI